MALKEKLIDKAQKLIQKGYLDKAIPEYRAAADADPKDISIRLRIGDLYVKLGKKPEAVKEYTEAARANAQRGFYLKAIAVYKQVLKLEENLDTHSKLAELYLKQRLIADAMGEYSYLVNWFESRGKTNEVLELLKKMVDIDPENVGVRLKLADLYQKLTFGKDALSEYSIIFEKLLSAGKLDKAEKVYLSLYNANPSEERVLNGLAELYRLKGDDTQRLKFLKGLFNYYSGASLAAEARRAAEDIIRINPDDPHASRFLKKDEKPVPKAIEASEAFSIASSIEVPVDGLEQMATEEPVVSWPEEEIEITIEGFEEAGVESRAEDAGPSEPLPEASEAVLDAGAPRTTDEGMGVAEDSTELPAAQPAPAGAADEIDIDIDDLIRGELPRMDGFEASVEPAQPEPLSEAADAQAPITEFHVEEDRFDQEAAPSVSEQAQAEEAVEEAGLDDVISVISAELQEDLSLSAYGEAQVEVTGPVIHEQESMESHKAETVVAETVVEVEQVSEATEEAVQSVSGTEPAVEVEAEPALELLDLEEQAREALEAPLDAVEVIEAFDDVQVLAASDEAGTAQAAGIMAEPLPEEPAADVSVSEVSGEQAIATSEIEVQSEEPVTDVKEEAIPEVVEVEDDELEEDLSSAIQELMEKMEPEEAESPQMEARAPEGVASKEEYVDLSAELGMEEALKDLAGPWGGKVSAETFDEYKDGIGNQLNKEDSETHYNLGIAYMEMELFSEASKEFKIAMKDTRLELDCYTRLGLCAMAEKNPEEAAVYYSRGLKAAARSDEKKALMYELALAYEASGSDDEAFELFSEIFAMDPDFREAASKVSSLAFTRPLVPLDDGYIEVELL